MDDAYNIISLFPAVYIPVGKIYYSNNYKTCSLLNITYFVTSYVENCSHPQDSSDMPEISTYCLEAVSLVVPVINWVLGTCSPCTSNNNQSEWNLVGF